MQWLRLGTQCWWPSSSSAVSNLLIPVNGVRLSIYIQWIRFMKTAHRDESLFLLQLVSPRNCSALTVNQTPSFALMEVICAENRCSSKNGNFCFKCFIHCFVYFWPQLAVGMCTSESFFFFHQKIIADEPFAGMGSLHLFMIVMIAAIPWKFKSPPDGTDKHFDISMLGLQHYLSRHAETAYRGAQTDPGSDLSEPAAW